MNYLVLVRNLLNTAPRAYLCMYSLDVLPYELTSGMLCGAHAGGCRLLSMTDESFIAASTEDFGQRGRGRKRISELGQDGRKAMYGGVPLPSQTRSLVG